MNLERQIKRHLLSRPQEGWIYPAPGCIQALEGELDELLGRLYTPTARMPAAKSLREAIVVRGADYRTLLELASRLVTAQDIGIILARGSVHNREDLTELLDTVRWELFLAAGSETTLRVESHASSLYHEGLMRECVTEQLEKLGARVVRRAPNGGGLRLRLRIVRNLASVELSLAGEPLWRRGYRGALSAAAPLREDLAQAAIRLALADALPSADPRAAPSTLLVPFAGSGTLLFEYLIIRYAIPPFVFRSTYAFEHFACGVPPSLGWVKRRLLEDLAEGLARGGRLTARLIDRSGSAAETTEASRREFAGHIAAAGACGGLSAGFPLDLEYRTEDVFARPWRAHLPDGVSTVFLPLNPPYGRRLAIRSTDDLYRKIGQACCGLARLLPRRGLVGFVLCPGESSWRRFRETATGLATRTSHFSHGGLDIRLCRFRS